MPPKKGAKVKFTVEQLQRYRNEQIERNIDLINFWQLIIGLDLTNETRFLAGFKAALELERNRMLNNYGQFLNQTLGLNANINTVNNNDILEDFFDAHINEFPKLRTAYNAILRKFREKLYRIEFMFRNVATGVNLAYFQLNNNSMMRRLKSIVLGYFLRLPYNVIYGVQDSSGYYGEVLEEFGVPINVYVEVLGDLNSDGGGGFFKYVNNTIYDLKKYQIFNDIHDFEDEPHCIIKCLINYLGQEIVADNKKKLMTILNNCDETNDLPTKKLKEICKLFNIEIRVHSPKLAGGKYLDRIENNKYSANRKIKLPVMDIGLVKSHYFTHEKVRGNINNTDSLNKALTTTRFICDLFNNGKFTKEHNLVNHEINRKAEMCDLSNILDEHEEFGNKNAHNINKKRNRNFYRKKAYLIDRSSEDIQIKYVNSEGELDPNKIKNVKIANYYCDCEAMFKGNKHIPYSIGKLGKDEGRVELFHNDPNNYKSSDLVKTFLNSFKTETINVLHFHNAKYDYSLLQKLGMGEIVSECSKEGTFYSVEMYYNNRYFIIYDTFKKINRKLSDIAKMFNLEDRKIEHTLYELHTIESMKLDKVKYENILYRNIRKTHLKFIANKDGVKKVSKLPKYYYKIVDDNKVKVPLEYIILDNRVVVSKEYLEVVDSKYFENEYFKHKEYYDDYLIVDCVVLKNSMLKFDQLMKDILGESYSPYTMTLSSIADLYACNEGCYSGCFQIKGQFLNFCKEASRGGRVCTAYNKIINTFETEGNIKIEDFDATSLYPSAIVMLKRIFGGIPVGLAERIPKLEFIPNYYGSYKVLVKSVNKQRAIPVISERRENIIDWTNDAVGKILYFDYFTVKDILEYHEAEIEILDGCYWTQYDPKLCDLVEDLFNRRKVYISLQKQEEAKDNPDIDEINKYKAFSEMIKLIMNSIYGKNGLKKSPKNNRFMDKHNYDYYCRYFYNRVKPVPGPKLKTIDGEEIYQFATFNDKPHSNRQHIAMCVLGCSKYIMNKFSMIAEDIGLDVYYTDTDSLHVCTENEKYVERLSKYGYSKERNGSVILREEYIKKYNEDPIGPNLGQFKSDFKMSNPLCTDIYSLGMIALGKKMYCHVLRGLNKQTGFIEYEVSCTMKGISERALDYYCNENYYGNKLTFFERVYNGEAINIDMLADKTLTSFDIKTGDIRHRETFPRIISVVNEDIKQLVLQDKDLSLKDLELKYQLPKQTIKKYLKEE